jgi:two-component system, NarL family, response regulator DevR
MKVDVSAINILLVDDHTVIRESLRLLLEQVDDFTVVAEAGLVSQAVKQAVRFSPQIVLMDMQLPDGDGTEACQQIVSCIPEVAVIILTAFDRDVYLEQAWSSGAVGFLEKTVDSHALVKAIRSAANGQYIFDGSQMCRIRAWQRTVKAKLEVITPREQEVLRYILEGKTNHQIAYALTLSENTVEKHVGALLGKVGVPSRQALITFVRDHRLGCIAKPSTTFNEQQ